MTIAVSGLLGGMSPHPIETEIIRRMLTRSIVRPNTIPMEYVIGWFSPEESEEVEAALEEAIREPSVPVESPATGEVSLTHRRDASRYLRSSTDYESKYGIRDMLGVDDDNEEGEVLLENLEDFDAIAPEQFKELNAEVIEEILKQLESRNDDLIEELNSLDKRINEWRSKAEKRQRKNRNLQLFGILTTLVSFFVGIFTGPLFL